MVAVEVVVVATVAAVAAVVCCKSQMPSARQCQAVIRSWLIRYNASKEVSNAANHCLVVMDNKQTD